MTRRAMKLLAVATTVLASLLLLPLSPAQAASLVIDLSPSSGAVGTTVTISGEGVVPLATVDVLWTPWFSGESCGPQPRGAQLTAQVTADNNGNFSTTSRAEQFPGYGSASWQGVIYLAKTSTTEGESTSNYVCFHFTDAMSSAVRFFPETGHSVGHGFLRYWEQFGGLPVFGYPITDEVNENGMTVQYFERARFEWHPGADPSHYDVLLGLLGNEVTQDRRNDAPFMTATPNSAAGCIYSTATGHNLCEGFHAYWEKYGGLSIYGFPISEEFQEDNPDTGKAYTVQYFQRARFEWHPGDCPTRFDVELGRLGAEDLSLR